MILVANKAESGKVVWNLGEMSSLGYGEPHRRSRRRRGSTSRELEAEITTVLPAGPTTPPRLPPPVVQIAIVGRVNVGKSSIVNALVHEERMIVSEVPGTTRDSVDVRFELDGEAFVVIDTAGMRKEKVVQNSLEFYAKRRAERAMRRADVSALVIDATADIARLDREIAGYAVTEHHPVVLVVNKWDLAPEDLRTGTFVEYLSKTLDGLAFAPVVFVSAKDGHERRAHPRGRALAPPAGPDARPDARAQQGHRGGLRDEAPPGASRARWARSSTARRSASRPPTFVLFVDDPAHVRGQLPPLPHQPLPPAPPVPRSPHPDPLQGPHALALEEPPRPPLEG